VVLVSVVLAVLVLVAVVLAVVVVIAVVLVFWLSLLLFSPSLLLGVRIQWSAGSGKRRVVGRMW
jgi:hypothetical protein